MRISDWSSDVCSSDLQRMDLAGLHQRQQALHIDARRRHQRVDQQDSLVEQGGATQLPPLVGREPPHERKAVRMHPRRGEPQNHVARRDLVGGQNLVALRSEEHTSELQSLMRISYAVFCLKKKRPQIIQNQYESESHK